MRAQGRPAEHTCGTATVQRLDITMRAAARSACGTFAHADERAPPVTVRAPGR